MDGDLKKDAIALAGEDGWILKQDFTKYALNTDLCKDDAQERVLLSDNNLWCRKNGVTNRVFRFYPFGILTRFVPSCKIYQF